LPIPPVPIRVIGRDELIEKVVGLPEYLTPKKTLGGGSGDSPSTLDADIRGESIGGRNY